MAKGLFGGLVLVLCTGILAAHALPAPTQPTEPVDNVDEIEDMAKLFENYEREYIHNDPWTDEQLLVHPSPPDAMDRHTITSRAANEDTVEGSGEDQTLPADETRALDESVATVRSIVDNQSEQRGRENRTIVVVVTTNIFKVNDTEAVDRNREQHHQLSFGLPHSALASTPHTQLDMHNNVTRQFFNGELSKELEEGKFELLPADDPVVAPSSMATEKELPVEEADIEPIIIAGSPKQSLYNEHTLVEVLNTDKINQRGFVPESIGAIPHDEVREKFLKDIPKETNVLSTGETRIYNGMAAAMKNFDDMSGYVVEDLPIEETPFVPEEKLKLQQEDEVKVVTVKSNGTYPLLRNSRQLEDLSDDELTAAERAVLEPVRRGVEYGQFRSLIPRINQNLSNFDALEDRRFMTILHTYLAQFMGRSYMETDELVFTCEALLARKHDLEKMTASTILDMSEYIEKTTFFNFPNNTALLPSYVLSGDRVGDQKKLDRLVYNRRFAADLWSRGRKPEDKAKMDADTLDLSMVAINREAAKHDSRQVDEEVSTVLGISNEKVLVYRQNAGTKKENDQIMFDNEESAPEVGSTQTWSADADYVPWFDMTAEERRDVEFAAYLHALIDTSQGLLPRIAYHLPTIKYDGIVKTNRGSRSVLTTPETETGPRSIVDHVAVVPEAIPTSETVLHHEATVQQKVIVQKNTVETPTEIEVISTDSAEHAVSNSELSNEFIPVNPNTKSTKNIEEEMVGTELVKDLVDITVFEPATVTRDELLAQDSLMFAPASTSSATLHIDEIEGSGSESDIPIKSPPTLKQASVPVSIPKSTPTIENESHIKTTPNVEPSIPVSSPKSLAKTTPSSDDDSSSSDESDEISVTSDEVNTSPASDLIRSVVEAVDLSHDLNRAIETFREPSTENPIVRQTRSQDVTGETADALVAQSPTMVDAHERARQMEIAHELDQIEREPHANHKRLLGLAAINMTTFYVAFVFGVFLAVSIAAVSIAIIYRQLRNVQQQFIITV